MSKPERPARLPAPDSRCTILSYVILVLGASVTHWLERPGGSFAGLVAHVGWIASTLTLSLWAFRRHERLAWLAILPLMLALVLIIPVSLFTIWVALITLGGP